MFVIQILQEELGQYRKAYDELKALFKPGAMNLLLVRGHVSWLYIELGIVINLVLSLCMTWCELTLH